MDKKNIAYGIKTIDTSKAVAIVDVDTSGRTVTGFFNTYNYLDSDDDIILPGAAKKSIAERGADSNAVAKIKHALFHDLTLLPGKIKVLSEKKIDKVKGIYFETEMANTTLGNDTLINYANGIYDNHSIGFQYVQFEFCESNTDKFKAIQDELMNPEDCEGKAGVFLVKEIKLYEGSTVSFGANAMTPFLGIKSIDKNIHLIKLNERLELLEKQLRNGTQSDDTMYAFEVSILQIKQMISDLNSQCGCKGCKPKTEEKKGLDLTYITEHFSLMPNHKDTV